MANRSLILQNEEWKRLNKLNTVKIESEIANIEIKSFSDEKRAISEKLTKNWDTTVLNKRRRELDKRKQLLADLETKQIIRDEEIKRKILEKREHIVEKSRVHRWKAMDSIKMLNSAIQHAEVLRERKLQIEFNNSEKKKMLEEEKLMIDLQRKQANEYEKELWNNKIKQSKEKYARHKIIIDELEKIKNKKAEEEIKKKEYENAELLRISREIKEETEKRKAKFQLSKQNTLKSLSESREMATKKKIARELENQDDDAVTAIIAESNEKIAKTRMLKEMEIIKAKQNVLDKIKEKLNVKQAKNDEKDEIVFLNAIAEQENRMQKEISDKLEMKKILAKEMEDYRTAMKELKSKEKERLSLSFQWEKERRLLESKIINELNLLRKKTEHKNKIYLREYLDYQCANNRAANIANKVEDQKYYDKLLKLWRQNDQEFNEYAREVIKINHELNRPNDPILKVIKEYSKKNTLLADAAKNYIDSIPNIPLGPLKVLCGTS